MEMGISPSDRDHFVFQDVHLDGERAEKLFLQFEEGRGYKVFNAKKEEIKCAQIGDKVVLGALRFSLVKTPKNISYKKLYSLQISPWQPLVQSFLRKLQIKPIKQDKNVLQMTFVHTDRHLSALFLNQLMTVYVRHLKEENEQLADAQLAYLEKRQTELAAHLDRTLEEQTHYLQENLGESGFVGLKQEIDMLAIPKQAYTSKLFDMELELKRFEKKIADNDKEQEEIRSQDLAKRKESLDEQQSPFEAQQHLLQNRLTALDVRAALFSPVREARADLKNDLQGINLETAQNLYVQYNNSLDAIQSQIRQLLFLRDQIHEPTFELSSLSSLLTDAVSQKMVEKASELSLMLHDKQNHSLREQERLKEGLTTQKNFLVQHIDQTVELNKEKEKLIDDKIASLQRVCVDLIENEKTLIKEKLKDLSARMGNLPDKWRLENQLQFKKELCMGIVEGISQLVESKNLHFQLFHVDSKPLDKAMAPLAPMPPHLCLFSMLVAFFSGSSLFAFHLGRGLLRGLPLTLESMQANKLPVCGSLSSFSHVSFKELNDRDLETLRRIDSYLEHKKKERVALVAGTSPDYSHNLAKLLALQGKKVLLIQCAFDAITTQENVPGLYHFLEGSQGSAPIRKREHYDFLPTGGSSRHATELLARPAFTKLLEEETKNYDVLLLFSSARPAFSEGHLYLKLADTLVVTANHERLEDLKPYIESKRALFVSYEE